ncbi:MAG: IS110 family transposase [Oscillospiraceae bacterium]|nr:IS110 family transposase [Oscillospiraceae bacterium]
MEVVYRRCCGIDVHKRKIVACLMTGQRKRDTREFGTTTGALREMAHWLKAEECEIVAMESTGSYWKPLYNVFELEGINAMVVNAAHMKTIPGRKTDIKDAEWIADLLRHGLLKASFVPDKDQREYRELTRYRASRVEERAREVNRMQKMLEGANIKLSSHVSDIMGKSAKKLIQLAISHKELTHKQISMACTGPLKATIDELKASLEGIISPLQRSLFAEVIRVIEEQTEQIERIEAMIRQYTTEAYDVAAKAIDAIPGIARRSAEQIIAEIGVDMSRFPTAHHLCAWAGVAPGDNESAGKRKSGKTRQGNKTLKKTLILCANSAINNKESFFYAQYQRLVVRKGRKKAIVAVAHSMLIAVYHVLSGNEFRDLGADYYTQFNREKKAKSLVKQLNRLGYKIDCPDIAA